MGIHHASIDIARAGILRNRHIPGNPLILPNAWDAASATAVVAGGFPAIATSSGAVATSLGYADHEKTPADEMLAAVTRISRSVEVPVTADLERGYGLAPGELAERLASTGAVGCNLEDTDPRSGELVDVGRQEEFLAAFREAAPHAVLNARIDLALHAEAVDAELADAVVDRGRRYLSAGADCVYPIAIRGLSLETVRALVDGIGGAVNIMCTPGGPSPAELAGAGVARISFGVGLFRAVQRHWETLIASVAAGRSPYS